MVEETNLEHVDTMEEDADVGESASGSEQEMETGNVQSNEGWADTMQKILKSKKPKRKKTVVLAKAKKLSALKTKSTTPEISAEIEAKQLKLRKFDWLSKGRIKPNPLDRNREKTLQKIAVRGVVQLFNAVNQLQKNISAPKSTTFKEEKKLKSINKNDFLDILLKGKAGSSKNEPLKNKENEELKQEDDMEEEDSGTWNVLKNNFMTSTKWKNWDKTKETEVVEI